MESNNKMILPEENIYPNFTDSSFDIKYAKRLLGIDDILIENKILGRKFDDPDETVPTAGSLVLVERFRVGTTGSGTPMENAETTYTNAALANSDFVIMSNGVVIHQLDDDPTERYASKLYEDDTITVNGGVYEGEVIEIYKI